MKKPGLLVLIAIWQFVIALTIAGGITIYTLIFPVFIGEGGWSSIVGTDRMIGGIVALALPSLFLFFFFVLALAGGIGLLLSHGYRWARIISIISCAFALILAPFGTIIGVLAIMYLVKPDIKEYFIL